MRPSLLRRGGALSVVTALAAACTVHDTATHWHGRTGPDGKPVFVTTTTAYGCNLAILLPALGDVTLDEVVDAACAHIESCGSDSVRVIETEVDNYWYAIPPLTWLVSPVAVRVSIEYVPCAEHLRAAAPPARR